MENLKLTCESNIDLMARYPDNYFDLAIVDPPYGIGETKRKNESRSNLAKSIKYNPSNWDNKPHDIVFFNELKRVSKHQIIFGANHFIENIPNANSSCWIVWDKDNGKTDFADCELAYCSFNSAVRRVKIRWSGMLQHDMKNKEIRIHPTQKPVRLYEWIILKYAEPGQKILDTNLGSGSIAVAIDKINKVEKWNLHLTACELDKKHFNDAITRIQQETTQIAIF
ncbi:site-specific DNA-methyltransferase (adenine-specific) [Thalassospira sp. 11-3]|nr:site-specific DNA-methyltransferase (adenine-specific) [Thalassospira sp. 11-3]